MDYKNLWDELKVKLEARLDTAIEEVEEEVEDVLCSIFGDIRRLEEAMQKAPYVNGAYNPNFGDDKVCECGHTYYRHFDSYEDMEACGCKYCGCYDFKEKNSD
uniref:Uncharacterized protein n=1 Tax=Bacillus phage KoopaTroopa TaxID=3234046 RepID=A0AB39C7D2_9CAUD